MSNVEKLGRPASRARADNFVFRGSAWDPHKVLETSFGLQLSKAVISGR